MHYALQQTIAPTVEPLRLSEAKLHLRVDYDDDDALIGSLILAAREYCENKTNRQFITATYVMSLDAFPSEGISIPRAPLQSIINISYYDLNGDSQTLASSVYRVDSSSEPGRLSLAYNQTWPGVLKVTGSINIHFLAGYGDAASDVPDGIKAAMKLLIGHWYANREVVNVGNITSTFEHSSDALLGAYALPEVA